MNGTVPTAMNDGTASIPTKTGAERMYRVLYNRILPLLILALGALVVLYYILGPAQGYMTGDCTDSLRWAQATVTSGKLISDSFYYAAILPFGGNLIFAPFVAVFGYSVTAQLAGLTLFALSMIGAMYFMVSGFGMGRCASAGFVTVCLLILSSSSKLREIMWEHIFYYNLGILFFCIGFGLAVRILRDGSDVMADRTLPQSGTAWGIYASFTAGAVLLAVLGFKSLIAFCVIMAVLCLTAVACGIVFSARARKGEPSRNAWLQMSVLTVFSVLAALNGLLSLVCYTLPLLAGILAERLLDGKTALFSRKNYRAAGLMLSLVIATLVGLLAMNRATGGVTAGYADAYSQYSDMSEWCDNFLGFFNHWFSLLGVSVTAGDPLGSVDSVWNMIRILGGLILLIFPVILLCMYRTLENRGVKMVLIGHMAVSAFILFAVTFGRLGNADWRLTPMLATAVFASYLGAWDLFGKRKTPSARVSVLLLLLLGVMAVQSASEIADMPANYGRQNSWHVVAEELEKRDLHYGYANFWWSQPVTMFSDDKVQVVSIYENTVSPKKYGYQMPYDCYEDRDTDRYFLLLTQTEMERGKMDSFLQAKRDAGVLIEEFTIQSEPYSLRGYSGDTVYVYVFSENLF